MAYELNGQSFEVDEEGYITDISLWNKDLAPGERGAGNQNSG